MSDYTYETYPTAGCWMEARFYSRDELKKIIECFEIMDKDLQKSMEIPK